LTSASDGGPLPPAGDPRLVTDPASIADTNRGSVADGKPDSDTAPEPAAPRITTFGLEGRSVPGVYLIGWVASLMGAGLLFISFQANAPGTGPWVFLAAMVLLGIGLTFAAGSQAIERGRRPDLAYRGPSPVLAFLVVVVLTFVALIVVLAPLSALGLDARSPAATTLNLLITMVLYVAVIRLLVVGPGALTWREMGVVRPDVGALRDLLLGALLAIPVVVVTLALGGLLSRFLEPSPSALPDATDAAGVVANLVSAAILAPIGEELFFRGFTTTAWARTSGARTAIIRGAVFFALAHVLTLFDASFGTGVQRALFSFVALLPVGLALGWVFLSRRSLYAAIGLHSAFNAIQVLALLAVTSAS
jgi:membrane protease YdiL (CAAX protease family)